MDAPEHCADCKFSAGPIILTCTNRNSEFFKGPVCLDGWCPEFEAPVMPPTSDVSHLQQY